MHPSQREARGRNLSGVPGQPPRATGPQSNPLVPSTTSTPSHTVNSTVIAKTIHDAANFQPFFLFRSGASGWRPAAPAADESLTRILHQAAHRVNELFWFLPGNNAAALVRHARRYQWFQCVMFATGGRLAGLKSVPLV